MTVSLQNGKVCVNNEEIFLLAGEAHYWAHQRLAWQDIVTSIKKSGLDIISVRPAWQYHELSPGEFDFEGRTQAERDLDGFLRMAEEAGLWIFFRFAIFSRPGPAVHAYWKGGGTPGHASDWHRLHPEFLKRANQYVSACGEVLKRHSIKNGGKLILVQCENEIIFDPSPRWSNQTLFGSVDSEFTFRRWLRERYGSLSALNETWKTDFAGWEEIVPLSRGNVTTYAQFLHYSDRIRYQEWYVEQCAEAMRNMIEDVGLGALTVLNTDPRFEPQNVTKLDQIVDLVGADYWYANLMPWKQVMEFGAHAKHLRSSVGFSWSPEFQSVTTAMHVDLEKVVFPQNALYFGLLSMMFGLKGWTWFMYVERSGQYFTPIDYWGQPVQPYYSRYCEMHRIFKELDWPLREKLARVGLVWYRPHFWLNPEAPWRAVNDWESSQVELARKHGHYTEDELDTEWHHVFERLHLADIDCEVFNPDSPHNHLKSNNSVLFYVGHDHMDLKAQEQLRQFADNGGHLVFLSSPPARDLEGKPVTKFADCPLPVRVSSWRGKLELPWVNEQGPVYELRTETSYLSSFGTKPKNSISWVQGPLGLHAYTMKSGKGKITVLGFALSTNALLELLRAEETPLFIRSRTPEVLSSAWKHPDGSIAVIVINTTKEVRSAQLEINPDELDVNVGSEVSVVYGEASEELSLENRIWSMVLKPKDAVVLKTNKGGIFA